MCGTDEPVSAYAHRFGALAILSPVSAEAPPLSPASSPASSQAAPPSPGVAGRLVFFNDADHACPVATHVRFAPSGALPQHGDPFFALSIHGFGDVGLAVLDAPPAAPALLARLKQPLHLHVGADRHGNPGIIGHKATLCRMASPAARLPAAAVAEGIVGFNSLPQRRAPL